MTDGRRVLVCDDEPQILRALRVILRDAGFEVITAQTAEEALDAAALRAPDAAILDLILPDGSGIDVCRSIREWSQMPILVLSAVGEEQEKVRALDAGRRRLRDQAVRARRADRPSATPPCAAPDGPRSPSVIGRTGWRSTSPATAWCAEGEEVHLTPNEFDLLRALARNRGRLMTHRALLGEVWGPAYEDDTHTLRVHIANLRRKIEPDPQDPRYIRTDPGVGYRFAA